MNKHLRSLPKSVWWSAGSLVLMLVGAFGPWAKIVDFMTIHGTDGGRDGWVVVAAAAVALPALVSYLHVRRRWLLAIPLLSGLAGVATTAYDISDLNGTASSNELFGTLVSTGWGIYVALIGSSSLALASVGLMIETRRKERLPVEVPSSA